MSEVDRKIFFYQIVWIKNNNDVIMRNMNALLPILTNNPVSTHDAATDSILEQIQNTSIKDLQDNQTYWRILKIRKNDLPLKFNIRDLLDSPLDLAQDEGLCEPTHFIIFDGKIIIGERNSNGFRFNTILSKKISEFLSTHSINGYKGIEIKPILKINLYDYIDKFKEIKKIDVRIATNYAKLVKNTDPSSFGAFFSAVDLVDDMYLTLSFSLGRKKKEKTLNKFESLLTYLKNLLRRKDWNKKQLRKVVIDGILTKEYEKINLIEEFMMVESKIAKLGGRSKAIDPNSMYQKILEVYRDHLEEINEYISNSNTE